MGAAEFVQVDVRVVASTNKNLDEEIERGNFREDLFYRLNVIPFSVPAAARAPRGYSPAGRPFPARIHHRLRPQAQGTDARGLQVLSRISLAGQRARAAQSDRAHRDFESAGARGCAPHSAGRRRAVRRTAPGRFGSLQEVREAAEREYILKKLEETERQRHADGRDAGPGAE